MTSSETQPSQPTNTSTAKEILEALVDAIKTHQDTLAATGISTDL